MENNKAAKKLSVLIADDNLEFRILIKDWLKFVEDDIDTEFEVFEAEDGEQAINIFSDHLKKDQNINLAIIDYIMPKLNGKDVIKHIVESHPIPIIALSGDIRSRGLDFVKEGAIMFLPKPFEIDSFKKAIDTAIDLSSIDTEIIFAEATIKKIEKTLDIHLELNEKNIESSKS